MSLKARIVSALVVAGIAVPAAAHSAHERQAKLRAEREMTELSQAIEPIAMGTAGERRVTLNGATMYFKKSTEQGSLDDVMDRIAKECASGSQGTAFGLSAEVSEGAERKSIRLKHVETQAGEGEVRASLCIFEKESELGGEE